MEQSIIIVPKNSLSREMKSKINKNGHLIIECDDPDKVRVISPEVSIVSNEFFMAALGALVSDHPTNRHEKFINNLYTRLSAAETKK